MTIVWSGRALDAPRKKQNKISMKKLFFLITLICFGSPVQSYAQTMRIDLSGGMMRGEDMVHDTVISKHQWENASSIAPYLIDLKLGYNLETIGLQPVLHFAYHFFLPEGGFGKLTFTSADFEMEIGIEKMFEIGYSKLAPGLGAGYDWQEYKLSRVTQPSTTFTINDIIYWAGLSLYTPFLKGVDLTLGYRVVYKKEQRLAQNFSDVHYSLETSAFRHLFTAGISIPLGKEEKKKK